MERVELSIVISAYNEEGNIEMLYKKLKEQLERVQNLTYEILFVNDGSKDKTLEICTSLTKQDATVKVIDFERNFGHEIAMTAGLDYAKGEAVIFMDADMQHPPEIVPEMIKHWKEGYEVVLTRILKNDQKSFIRNIIVKFYYYILNFLSDVKIPPATPDFRLIGRRFIDILRRMDEQERMFRGMLNWLGTKNVKIIEFQAPKRFSGESHYNFKASMKLAINSIVQFSTKPLRVATYLGIFSAFFAGLFAIFVLFEYFVYSKSATGYITTVLLILFFSSIQLIILGIIGEYVGRIHIETKKRPLYFAKLIQKEND